VLELATIIAGGFSGMLLADFGADVLKVEHPSGDPYRALGHRKNGIPLAWKRISRNKRLVVLDLHEPDAQATVRRWASEADVVSENFRPGTLEKWNLGYDALSAENPGLVLLRISGWGQTGPYKDRPGFGSVGEAVSGFAAINGEAGGPPLLPPFGLSDHIAGLYGAFAALAALRERDRSGRGQVIDLALYEAMFSVIGNQIVDYDQIGFIQQRNGNRVHYASPRNVYRARDDRWIALSGSTQSTARRVFLAMGRADLIADERYATNAARVAHSDELEEFVAAWVRERDSAEVMRAFADAGVAAAPVLGVDDIMHDPHYTAREMVVELTDDELGTIRMQGVVPKMSRTPGEVRWAGGRIGQDQADVLGRDDVDAAADGRVIGDGRDG
jgi:crotonobetainyl-CoA:carnitine CoA-transferase CaiB-like acyl-CoA transferase